MNAAAKAMLAYKLRTAELRATMNTASREFAAAMTAACADYERAMVTDIGAARARKLGADRGSI